MTMFTIKVPASSANMGPGFDSVGLAMNRYLTLQVVEQDEWEFVHQSNYLPNVSHYRKHFIYHIVRKVANLYKKELPPCKVIVNSDIPLARGLGSSASAVVAGIELANQLCNLSLSQEEKLLHATKLEGHPDNVAPALLGGVVISAMSKKFEIDYTRLPNLEVDLVLYIPNIKLRTEDARKVLPSGYGRGKATEASGISNLMIASLITGDYELAGKMMEKDLFHEPYRAKLIPNYNKIKKQAKKLGAYGTVISGAGPTMISFTPLGKGEEIARQMTPILKNYEVSALQIDERGLVFID